MTGDLYEALAWNNDGKPLGVSITTPTPLYEGEALRAKLTKLDDLLAVIHRDGGHYQAEHGTAKAIEDAIAAVHALRAANGDLQSHFDALSYDFRRWKEATKEVLRGIGDGLELDQKVSADTYHLVTIKDVFDKVPPEKIRTCMLELAKGMDYAKMLGVLAGAPTHWPDSIDWVDDDKGEIAVKVNAGGDPLLTLRTGPEA
jgi:hypothetical protein